MDMSETPHPRRGLAGEFRVREPMRKHVSWRAGGTAARAYFPRDLQDLARFLRTIPRDEPVHCVGLGSNLLVRDGGVRGTVIFTHGALKQVHLVERAGQVPLVYAQAGVASPKVARFAATHGLRGAEFLAGVPGTVGGALAMNAGCYGSETWETVDLVLMLTRDGQLERRPPSDFEIAYRHVAFLRADARHEPGAGKSGGAAITNHESRITNDEFFAADSGTSNRDTAPINHESRITNHEFFAAAWFRFSSGDGEESRRVIKELLQRRIATQPLEQPNAGSVFRNPPGDYAARLIESCGLKGHAIGGAMVSPKHANFIVNTGSARAAEIEALIEHVQDVVAVRCGVRLVPEVRIIGERA